MNASPFAASLSRRGFVQSGFSSVLGLGLSSLLQAQSRIESSRPRKTKSVIIVFLTGAASHHDTFDMKPDAPAEIRGQFMPINSSTPGLHICEHLPYMARVMHHCALVRSLAHREENHLLATHQVLTGMAIPNGIFDQIASRNDWPCYAGALNYSRPRTDGVPNGVTLPTFLMEGPLIWPGQHAGFLGAKHDPWHIKSDPNAPGFKVESVRAADGTERMQERRSLLENMNRLGKDRAAISDQQEQAFNILTSGKVGQAFELEREPTSMRDRYGRHSFGQSLLLARRLVEAGVPIVQCNMGRVQNWDNHNDVFNTLKNRLLPPTDRGVSALFEDLHMRGLLQDTLVAMFGEFGRTPKVNAQSGRDHWGRAFFALFAGGGVKGGQVIGKTDKSGAAPITHPYSPMDLGATFYSALGVDHEAEVRDQLGRPVRLNTGKVIDAIYG
jgi:Protein of unknown function (DUF1501)